MVIVRLAHALASESAPFIHVTQLRPHLTTCQPPIFHYFDSTSALFIPHPLKLPLTHVMTCWPMPQMHATLTTVSHITYAPCRDHLHGKGLTGWRRNLPAFVCSLVSFCSSSSLLFILLSYWSSNITAWACPHTHTLSPSLLTPCNLCVAYLCCIQNPCLASVLSP